MPHSMTRNCRNRPVANLGNEHFFLGLVYSGALKITKSGRAFNLITGREIAVTSRPDAYRKLSWQHPETKKIVQVQLHRLVWAVYRGVPDDPELVINHKDGVKPNCRLRNLELVTQEFNSQHAVRTGLNVAPKAEDIPKAKFTNAQVRHFRLMLTKRKLTARQLSRELRDRYGFAYGTSWSMLMGKTYKSVT